MSTLRYESERYRTFESFPTSNLNIRKLTSAGFWYTHRSDFIRCAFCNLEFGNLTVVDDPLKLHREWSKDCPFITNTSTNVTLESEHDIVCLLPSNNCSHCLDNLGISLSPSSKKGENVTSVTLNLNRRVEPLHALFEDPKLRLKSFKSWPLEHWLAPRALADAGFFYSGTNDKTICFSCGGALKDWQREDEPWEEHALYFSRCRFLLERKGREYVKSILGDRPATMEPEELKALADNPSKLEASSEQFLCQLCLDKERKILFLPCGHLVTCVKCGMRVKSCPVCRSEILATTRVILS